MTEETKKETNSEEKQLIEKPIEKMTAKELREIAREIPGVTGVHAMKKDQLLTVVKEYRGIKDQEPLRKEKKKTAKPALSIKKLKEKITLLRQEKEAAREARDRKKLNILRRRINRLKKQTRKVARA